MERDIFVTREDGKLYTGLVPQGDGRPVRDPEGYPSALDTASPWTRL